MLLAVRKETEFHFLFGTVILGFLSIFKNSQASKPYEALNSCTSRMVKGMWGPLSRWDGHLQLSLCSPQGTQTCLHLVRWKTSLKLSHCREIRLTFQSGPLSVHSTWQRKHRVPVISLLLRDNSSWGACGKLAHRFSQRQWISSHLGMIWGARSFPRVAVLKLIFI